MGRERSRLGTGGGRCVVEVLLDKIVKAASSRNYVFEKIPFAPKYSSVLADVVEGDDSRPHSKPALAKKGWREYYHVKVKSEHERVYHKEGFEAKNERV